MWLYPPQTMAVDPVVMVIGGIVGALLGAWSSSMVGSSVANSALRPFHGAIEAGKVLLMVDVPFAHVEQVRELVAGDHPEAEWGGVAPQIPAFP
jgi:hypothetical protein